jgi:hypothetical protein
MPVEERQLLRDHRHLDAIALRHRAFLTFAHPIAGCIVYYSSWRLSLTDNASPTITSHVALTPLECVLVLAFLAATDTPAQRSAESGNLYPGASISIPPLAVAA